MKQRFSHSNSPWQPARQPFTYPSLAFNIRADVVVIGGGITGVTAAYLLKRGGATVALVEPGRVGSSDAGHPTAHGSAVPGTSFKALVDRHGEERTRLLWDAGTAAIARIRAAVRDERINCRFAWVRGCFHASMGAEDPEARELVRREASVASSLGIDASFVESVPGLNVPGVFFAGQATLDPMAYLDVLADRIPGGGSYVFEDTEIDAVEGDRPVIVRSGTNQITTNYVVTTSPGIADGDRSRLAGLPVAADLKARDTYGVRGVVKAGALDPGLYWTRFDAASECLRVNRIGSDDELIAGSQEHGLASGGAALAVRALEMRLRARVPGVVVSHRWIGQVVESTDGLPVIGETGPDRFLASGYGANGVTYGTLGGMMAADAALGRTNAWQDLFSAERILT
jgi:glycine/D-amino acid oxidase-like deaminating enzyme